MKGGIDRGMARVLERLAVARTRLSPEDYKVFVADLIHRGKEQGGREEIFWCAFEDQFVPPTGWREDWERGPWDQNGDTIRLLRTRSEAVKQLVRRFPPSCVVRAVIRFGFPAPGQVGIVRQWHEPGPDRPEGSVGVLAHPQGSISYDCEPGWLEVVGYHRGLTTEIVAALLQEGE